MKKALNLILMYFISLISVVVVGTVLYSFYINVLNFVAGTEIKFFSKKEIYDAFFYIAFCVLFLICPFVSYYKIRHPGGVPQLIAFVLISLLTWALFIPCVFNLNKKYEESKIRIEEPARLSKGYFRQIDDKVYYLTKNISRNSAGQRETTAVIIDTGDDAEDQTSVSVEKIIDSPDLPIHTAAEPYKEILVKNTFQKNDLPISINFRNLISTCFKNIYSNKGFLTFIGFLSIGFVLCSVFALSHVFKWKLLNTMIITLSSVLILIVNSNPELIPFRYIETRFYYSGFFRFLSKFGTEPLLFFTNYIVGIIFILIGVILFIVHNHKNKSRNR